MCYREEVQEKKKVSCENGATQRHEMITLHLCFGFLKLLFVDRLQSSLPLLLSPSFCKSASLYILKIYLKKKDSSNCVVRIVVTVIGISIEHNNHSLQYAYVYLRYVKLNG